MVREDATVPMGILRPLLQVSCFQLVASFLVGTIPLILCHFLGAKYSNDLAETVKSGAPERTYDPF